MLLVAASIKSSPKKEVIKDEVMPDQKYVFRVSDLPKLNIEVDRGTDFEAWELTWKSYRRLSGLIKESKDS